jgi:hypothetical protein
VCPVAVIQSLRGVDGKQLSYVAYTVFIRVFTKEGYDGSVRHVFTDQRHRLVFWDAYEGDDVWVVEILPEDYLGKVGLTMFMSTMP